MIPVVTQALYDHNLSPRHPTTVIRQKIIIYYTSPAHHLKLAGGFTELEGSAKKLGDDIEGVEKDGSNGVGPWDVI